MSRHLEAQIRALEVYATTVGITDEEVAEAIEDMAVKIGEGTISSNFDETVYVAIWKKFENTKNTILNIPQALFTFGCLIFLFKYLFTRLSTMDWLQENISELLSVAALFIGMVVIYVVLDFRKDSKLKKVNLYYQDNSENDKTNQPSKHTPRNHEDYFKTELAEDKSGMNIPSQDD